MDRLEEIKAFWAPIATEKMSIGWLIAEVERVRGELEAAKSVAAEQAEDEGLWFVAETAPEAYLQQALRRLHAAVEGEAS